MFAPSPFRFVVRIDSTTGRYVVCYTGMWAGDDTTRVHSRRVSAHTQCQHLNAVGR